MQAITVKAASKRYSIRKVEVLDLYDEDLVSLLSGTKKMHHIFFSLNLHLHFLLRETKPTLTILRSNTFVHPTVLMVTHIELQPS